MSFKPYSEMTKAQQAKFRAHEKASEAISKHLREIVKIINAKADSGSLVRDKSTLDLIRELDGRSVPNGFRKRS